MPRFYVQAIGASSTQPVEISYDFDDVDAAKAEARAILAQMATGGLPSPPLEMISVGLFDEHHRPIFEIRLIVEEIPK
jgi:hypothetical protein